MKTKSNKLCLCRALMPMLFSTKIFGMIPMTSTHKNNQCVFKTCKWYMVWSVIIVLILIAHLTMMYGEIMDLFRKKISSHTSLHSTLINIISAIYCVHIAILTVISIFKTPKVAKTLNKMSLVLKEGLLCQSSLKIVLNLQFGFIGIAFLTMIVQLSAVIYIHFSGNYEINFGYKHFSSQFFQNMTFVFYIVFLSYCAVFMGILGCFEKSLLFLINFQESHPLDGVYLTNNNNRFMGIRYELCKSNHFNNNLLRKFKSHEIIDYLRSLHEEICGLIYDCNQCVNPQLLCHLVVEIAALIINYYAVVIYIVYDFNSSISNTIHFLNCLFVVVHTFGVLIFLNNSQQLQNMIKGLIPILLEYSTKLDSPEEHLQVTLFIEKLRQHRPVSASGVVDINMNIAGSICANILTYVLVALQFEVSKE